MRNWYTDQLKLKKFIEKFDKNIQIGLYILMISIYILIELTEMRLKVLSIIWKIKM